MLCSDMHIPHFTISQAALMALVSQLIAFAVSFGLLSSSVAQAALAGSAALVNAAFLFANSIHAFAHAHAS